jgi:hypothetical protein
MRMLPNRMHSQPGRTAQVKRVISDVKHRSAPLKGLNLSSALTTGDPLTAPILMNWVIDEDRLRVRPGIRKIATCGALPLQAFLPYSGSPAKMLVANQTTVYLATTGATIQGGFTSGDWSTTMFANLSQQKYLIGVNGANGVWSYDGTAMVKEVITAPAGKTYIVPDTMNIVTTHMNRLFFADKSNLAVFYLPVQTKAGELVELPLQGIFKKGGYVQALSSWSIDGGSGMDDRLCIFTDQGEVAIYQGLDPDSDWSLVGVFKFDAPMSKRCVVNFGGDLYVMISTGLVPMSVMIRAEDEQLAKTDKAVLSAFRLASTIYRANAGWQVILDHASGHVICNLPTGAKNGFAQMVRKMHVAYWVDWRHIPSRSWGWLSNMLYCADEDGNVYTVDAANLNDDGKAINIDMLLAWSLFGTPALKQFKMIRPLLFTDGLPRPYIDMRVDYDNSAPKIQPDVTFTEPGAIWDQATWDVDPWAQGVLPLARWQGCTGIGVVAAPRLVASVYNCEFAVAGFDVLYETGSIMR